MKQLVILLQIIIALINALIYNILMELNVKIKQFVKIIKIQNLVIL